MVIGQQSAVRYELAWANCTLSAQSARMEFMNANWLKCRAKSWSNFMLFVNLNICNEDAHEAEYSCIVPNLQILIRIHNFL